MSSHVYSITEIAGSSEVSHADAIEKAVEGKRKTAAETAGEETGCCIYNAGGKTYKATLSRSQCAALNGVLGALRGGNGPAESVVASGSRARPMFISAPMGPRSWPRT